MTSSKEAAASGPARETLDRFGAVASSACAVHCAIAAFLPALFGALGLGFLIGHRAEWGLTLLAIALAAGALIRGWRRHRALGAAALLALGIVGLLASRAVEGSTGHGEHDRGSHHTAKPPASPGGGEPTEAEPDEGPTHVAGTLIGMLAGGLLLGGHRLNVRAARAAGRAPGAAA